jgi:hypothetical protein
MGGQWDVTGWRDGMSPGLDSRRVSNSWSTSERKLDELQLRLLRDALTPCQYVFCVKSANAIEASRRLREIFTPEQISDPDDVIRLMSAGISSLCDIDLAYFHEVVDVLYSNFGSWPKY